MAREQKYAERYYSKQEVGSGMSPIIVTKGKGMMNSHLQNTSITIPLI